MKSSHLNGGYYRVLVFFPYSGGRKEADKGNCLENFIQAAQDVSELYYPPEVQKNTAFGTRMGK